MYKIEQIFSEFEGHRVYWVRHYNSNGYMTPMAKFDTRKAAEQYLERQTAPAYVNKKGAVVHYE